MVFSQMFRRVPGGMVIRAILLTSSLLMHQDDAPASSVTPVQQESCTATDVSYEEMVKRFQYNAKEPLQIYELGVTVQDGVSVHDITYVSQSQTVSAYLVVPPGAGPFAAIEYVHWLDASPTANRAEFLHEAIMMAHEGTVSLLPQGIFPWMLDPKDAQHDCRAIVAQTIAIRRGLDLLLSKTQVDPKRVAFVGHDYGAMYGVILAGVDRRIQSLTLMAPTGRFSNWNVPFWLTTLTPGQRLNYALQTAVLDPINYIAHVAPAPVFFQFARQDKYVSLGDANNLLQVASQPHTVKQYDADHSLTDGVSQMDRIAWVSSQLGLH